MLVYISIIAQKKWDIIIRALEKLTDVINADEGILTLCWSYSKLAHSHFGGYLLILYQLKFNIQPLWILAISVLGINSSINKIHKFAKRHVKIIVFNCLNLDSMYQSLVNI